MAKGDGLIVKVRFTEPLVLDETIENPLAGNESNFKIKFDAYDPAIDRNVQVARDVIAVTLVPDSENKVIQLTLAEGNVNSMQQATGDIIVAYDGGGTLIGLGDPVAAFELLFTPEGVTYKGHQSNIEHIDIAEYTITSKMTKVTYHSAKHGAEHVSVNEFAVSSTLTHIDNI